MTVRCRDCGEGIMFVRIEDTGTPMPVDPFPDPDGNVYARHVRDHNGLLGHVARKDEQLPEGWRIYMPHFASCPSRQRVEPTEPPMSAYVDVDQEPTLFGTTEGITS